MVRHGWLGSLCVLLLAAAMRAAPISDLEPRHDAAVDGEGTIWGLSGFSSGAYNDHLIVFRDGAWQNATDTPPEGAHHPAMLRSGPGGSVLCFWQAGGKQYVITKHRSGRPAETVARLTLGSFTQNVWCFVDSRGDAWITGPTPDIVRLRAEGPAEVAYHVQPEEMRRFHTNNENTYNPILCHEDAKGTLWFGPHEGATNAWSLRGFLKYDGTAFTRVGMPKNLREDARVTYFAPMGKSCLWLAVTGPTGNLRDVGGLLEYDLESGLSAKVPEPEPGAFWKVQYFACAGDSAYVSAEKTGRNTGFDLWRLRDGVWARLLCGYNPLGQSARGWQQFLLRTSTGVIVSGDRETPWFASDNGAHAIQLQWQAGLPMTVVERFLPLGNDRYLAIGGKRAFMGELKLPPPSVSQNRVQELAVYRGWSLDTRGHAWASLAEAREALSEWDGRHWIRHPIPASLTNFGSIRADTKGRVWMFPASNEDAAGFYDSLQDTWRTYPTVEAAFADVSGDLPVFTGNRPQYFTPESASGHRIVYAKESAIAYFDGTAWKRWKLTEIKPGQRFWFRGAPFFSPDGRLCVSLMASNLPKENTWQWDESQSWQPCAIANRYPDPDAPGAHPLPPEPEIPEGCVTRRPDSSVIDNLGTTWLSWQGELYRAVPGLCEPVFAKTMPHPFRDGRKLVAAWVDAYGNTFLETHADGPVRIRVQCKLAVQGILPAPSVFVSKTDADCIRITLQSDPSARMFLLRLNQQPWQYVTGNSLDLESLEPGHHTIEAFAFDAYLQRSASAAKATFEIKISPQKQLAGLIERLKDPDYARRKSAIEALARQPARAVPALNAAREAAGDDQRWWIDAALQRLDGVVTRGAL